MKYIIGMIIGIVIASGTVVYAKEHGIIVSSTTHINTDSDTVTKIYDNDNGVVCYLFARWGQGAGSISCLK